MKHLTNNEGKFIEPPKLDSKELISIFLNFTAALAPEAAIPISAFQLVLYTGVNLFNVIKYMNFTHGLKGDLTYSIEDLEKMYLEKNNSDVFLSIINNQRNSQVEKMNYICGILIYQHTIKNNKKITVRELNQIEFLLTLTINDFKNFVKLFKVHVQAKRENRIYTNNVEFEQYGIYFSQTTLSKMRNYGMSNDGAISTGIDISHEGVIFFNTLLEVKDILLKDNDFIEIHDELRI